MAQMEFNQRNTSYFSKITGFNTNYLDIVIAAGAAIAH